LTRAWQRGRLAHAYLFAGQPGIGKRLFAGELAKALLCESAPAGRLEACDQCVACTLVEAGTHPDLFTVGRPEESNEIPIEMMRELCRGFGLKSARGRGKVAILDDADDLNDASANCFLKTLEEPPPRSLFILVGTSMDRQLATIVSRCQVIRFAPLPTDVVVDLLKTQGVADAKQVQRLVRLAGGSPGQALALADPALWQFRSVLLEGLSGPWPDTVGLSRAWIQFIEEAGKESAAQRRQAGLVLRLLIDFLKDALGVALSGSLRFAEPEDQRLAQSFLRENTPDQILALLERCLEAETQLDRYVQTAVVLEGLLDAAGQLAPAK
jgi:DNA polymerase-3 subunit delta'